MSTRFDPRRLPGGRDLPTVSADDAAADPDDGVLEVEVFAAQFGDLAEP